MEGGGVILMYRNRSMSPNENSHDTWREDYRDLFQYIKMIPPSRPGKAGSCKQPLSTKQSY